MFAPQPLLNFSEAERPLGERLLKLAAETDRIEGYQTAHAVELARLAEKLGQRLGLRGVDLSALKFAALAHDLGERAMKRDYLLRPGGLSWEEQLDLWRHPIIGEQAAADAKLPRQSQLLIRWHHEWWNGQGYPDGLAGADIPLGARILRVVDTYCALLSDRPHRARSEAASAEQFIADQAGLEADPRVVQEFLALLAEERPARAPEVPLDFRPSEPLAEPSAEPLAEPLADSLVEPVAGASAEPAVSTDTPAPTFVSVWDSARQAAEPESFGWQRRPTHEENERWPTTQDFPEGAETNPFPPEPAAAPATEVVPVDATPTPTEVVTTTEEKAALTGVEPVAEPEPVAPSTDTLSLASESTEAAVAEQKVIQVLEEPDGIPRQKESETL